MHPFPGCPFGDESKRSPYIPEGEIILALHLLESHPSGETADDKRNRHPRAPDHRLTMTNSGIDDDAAVPFHGSNLTKGPGFPIGFL